MRRPQNLPALSLPKTHYSSSTLREDVHTPIPFTPVTIEEYPLAMTPDTPGFSLGAFDPATGPLGGKRDNGKMTEEAWTEDEEGLAQSFLMHPPRPLRTSYPPGTLPPPAALDEITSQILQSSSSETWRHSWTATRHKLFNIARAESMEATGGHRRKISDIIPISNAPSGSRSRGPLESVLGGIAMNRQHHSMDSLCGEGASGGFSEALRLSSNLQDSAQDSQAVLTAGDGLSSPLAFTFTFAPASNGRKPSLPFPSTSSSIPRPASLLQRGRSFTSEDFARDLQMKTVIEDEVVMDAEEIESTQTRPEMRRSISSPLSLFTSSPPSSISSSTISESNDFEPDLDLEPYTPLNQTFPLSASMIRNTSDASTETTPGGLGSRTPSITLTVNSPTLGSPVDRSTPRLISSTDSPTPAFAALSINAPLPLVFPSPAHKESKSTSSQGIKRSIKPAILSRSLSDTSAVSGGSVSNGTLGFAQIHPSGRESKRQKPMGLSGSRLRPGPGLSVMVPKPGGLGLGGLVEELRSPFEPKPVHH